jgi:hypothetical protein
MRTFSDQHGRPLTENEFIARHQVEQKIRAVSDAMTMGA